MTTLERAIRPSPVTGVRVDPLLQTIMVAELVKPSNELWLVSAWISDVPAVDNSRGEFDALFPDAATRTYRLSETIANLIARRSRVTIVTRPDAHNSTFLDRLTSYLVKPDDQERLRICRYGNAHEKTFCGQDWVLTGSMNFTVKGMNVNDEVVYYRVNAALAAQTRLDFHSRWEDSV